MYGFHTIAYVVRVLAVMFLVAATYNPSGYSYYHWAFRADTADWALKIFIGFLIIFGYAFCGFSTWRSLRLLLSVPLILSMAAFVWLLSDWGLIDLTDWVQRTLVFETGLVILLGTGVSFSLIRYRLAGQMDSRSIT